MSGVSWKDRDYSAPGSAGWGMRVFWWAAELMAKDKKLTADQAYIQAREIVWKQDHGLNV